MSGGKVEGVERARRIGSSDSKTRAHILDAAEQLLLEEGYPAVTSRRVGRQAGISAQLVHYYFRTMDELFEEMFRRRAEENLARFAAAVEEGLSLRALWETEQDLRGSAFTVEFVALANHRKGIRSQIAAYAERYRAMQLAALGSILDEYDLPEGVGPEAVLLTLMGVSQIIAIEDVLGVRAGHAEVHDAVEHALDHLEATRRRPARG